MKPAQFTHKLITWQRKHGRQTLPWQKQRTPYRVWVSEIMLQQTQVDTVIPYYHRFLQRFAHVKQLAAAAEDEVLALWSGLGYYRRARFMHQAARIIVNDHRGRFPRHITVLQKLPGIGRSTAGAILSLACGQAHPILDGNVKRVLCRFHAIDRPLNESAVIRTLWTYAEQLAHAAQEPAVYTQAMMDLGATLCRRTQADCLQCPLHASCQAKRQGIQAQLPRKTPKTALPLRQTRLLIIQSADNKLLLEKRPPSGVWPGLWSLPECPPSEDLGDWCRRRIGIQVKRIHCLTSFRHSFSHYHLDIEPVLIVPGRLHTLVQDHTTLAWHGLDALTDLGLPAPVSRLITTLQHASIPTSY